MMTKLFITGLFLTGAFSLNAQTTSAVESTTKTGYGISNGAITTLGTGGTFIGYQAGIVTTGANNSFFGATSGYSNTSGINNTFIGNQAGRLNVSGNYNVYLGSSAGRGATGSNNVFLGYNAGYNETGNNLLYINNTSNNNPLVWGDFNSGFLKAKTRFGINLGTAAPRATLDVNGKILMPLASGVDNESAALTMTAADDFLYKSKYINSYGFGFYLDQALVPFAYMSGYWGLDFFSQEVKAMKLNSSGQLLVGLGETSAPTTAGGVNVSTYKLFVKGGILTEEVRINLQSGWADYVFAKDYKLASLDEVEKYIADNGHLPNVPSAAQVKEEGIEVGQIAIIQQEKIEELTLYVIEQNKKIEQQQTEIDQLKAAVKLLLAKTE